MIDQILLFAINFIFTSYVYILLARLFLQKLGTSWTNPVARFVIVFTEKPLKPLRFILPGIKGFDLSIIFLAFLVEFVEVFCLVSLKLQLINSIPGMAVFAVGELLQNTVNLFFMATIFSAVLSWFSQLQGSPVSAVVVQLASPLQKLVSRWMPIIGGFDLSPIVILFGLKIFEIVIVDRILIFGLTL